MKLKPVDFARQAGVSKQAISAKIKNKTLIIDEAGFLDTDNPINSAYISNAGRKSRQNIVIPFPAAIARPAEIPPPGAATQSVQNSATQADMAAAAGVPAIELLDYTLRDVVMRFNGIYNLEKHAKILQNIMMAADKEQRMAERSMRLISKDFVAARIFPFLNMLMKQLIEYPESAADNIISKVLSDGPEAREAIIAMIRDGISRIIAKSKEQVIKEIESMRPRHGLGGEEPEDFTNSKESNFDSTF